MRFLSFIHRNGERPVAPLMGYPGAKITGTSLRANLFTAVTHAKSIYRLWETYKPDIVFPMMDLAVEAGALGLRVRFPENGSPTVEEHPIASEGDLARFRDVNIREDARLQSFVETIRRLKSQVEVAVAGYVVGPFTLTGLMMGASAAAVATVRDPQLVHRVTGFTAQIARTYAEMCLAAGADFITFLEPTAALLSPSAFRVFSGNYISRLAREIGSWTVLHICGSTTHLLEAMCETGVNGLSLDSAVDFPKVASSIPRDVVIMGNIDPVAVMGSSDSGRVRIAVHQLQDAMRGFPNFVLSTGCDLPLETPLKNIYVFMEEARK